MPVAPQSELYPASLAQAVGYSDSALDLAIESVGARDLDGDGLLDLGGAPYTIDFVVCSESGTKVAAVQPVVANTAQGNMVMLLSLGRPSSWLMEHIPLIQDSQQQSPLVSPSQEQQSKGQYSHLFLLSSPSRPTI